MGKTAHRAPRGRRNHRPRTCRGKVRYRDAADARAALHALERADTFQRIPSRTYPCPACKGWHLTSESKRGAA